VTMNEGTDRVAVQLETVSPPFLIYDFLSAHILIC
jgi:hypothetical protein